MVVVMYHFCCHVTLVCCDISLEYLCLIYCSKASPDMVKMGYSSSSIGRVTNNATPHSGKGWRVQCNSSATFSLLSDFDNYKVYKKQGRSLLARGSWLWKVWSLVISTVAQF